MADLKSSNGSVYRDLLKNDKVIVLTTENNTLAIYEPSGRLIAELDSKNIEGKLPPSHLQVQADGKGLFYVDHEHTLYSLDLAEREKAKSVVVKKGLSAEKLILVGQAIYFVSPEGRLHCLKKEGAEFKETPVEGLLPSDGEPAKITRVVSCGKDQLLVHLDNKKSVVFSTKAGAVKVEDIPNVPSFSSDHPVFFDEQSKLIFGVSAEAVVQYSFASRKVVAQYPPGQFGKLQTFGVSGDKVVSITDTHYLGYRVFDEKGKASHPELLAAFKFKFAVKHPGAQIFFNLDDMQTLTMVWKDQVDKVTFSLDLDKVEPVDLHETRNNVSRTGGQAGSVARSGARSQHTEEEEEEQMEEAGEQAGEQKKKKKGLKKKKVVKKRKRSFDLNGMQHIKPLGYNALKDEHLKPYFYSYRVRDHLVKQSLVEKNDSDNERRVHH